jgi:hypothetical protein
MLRNSQAIGVPVFAPCRPAVAALCLWTAFSLSAHAQNLEGLPETLEFRTELTKGHYACRDGDRWTNQFDITGAGDYEFRGSETELGTFDYVAEERTIHWTSGPFASEPQDTTLITGYNTTRIEDGKPVILLHFEDPAYGASTEYCALVE